MKLSKKAVLTFALLLIFVGFILWALYQNWPSRFPNWAGTVFIIIAGFGVLLTVIATVFADLLLPVLDRTTASRDDTLRDLLRRDVPIRRVNYDQLVAGLGRSGQIPWIDRGVTTASTLMETNRLAVVGPMKSGKTREALELIRRAQEDGLVVSVYEPTSSLDLIDVEALIETVAIQAERHPMLLFVDELGLRQAEEDLARLAICIDAICTIRPNAKFVMTLQEERLSGRLRDWLKANGFESAVMPDLTQEHREWLVEKGHETLGVAIVDEALDVLAGSAQVVKPWDVVSVLQAAPQAVAGAPALDTEQVRSLLSRSQESIWRGQQQEVISAQPMAGHLLDAIVTFTSAGVTPRASTVNRYAEYRAVSMIPSLSEQLDLNEAMERWRRFDIVSDSGLYTIPEPRLLPLMITKEEARVRLLTFLDNYKPGVWTVVVSTILQPLEWLEKVRFREMRWMYTLSRKLGPLTQLWNKLVFRLAESNSNPISRIIARLYETVWSWEGDRALLVQEMGMTESRSAYLSSSALLMRGKLYGENRDYVAALGEFNRALALSPDDPRVFCYRGITYILMENYDAAMADFNRAIEIDSEFKRAVAERGFTYRLKGNYDAAMADFNRAIEIDSEYKWVITQRGITYILKENYDAAIADFNRAIEIDPKYVWAIAERGLTYRLKENCDAAMADFNRVIEIDPKYVWAIAERGFTYRLKENYDAAMADFNRAIEIDPKYDWAIAERGLLMMLQGDDVKGLTNINIAIELDPDDSEYYLLRSIAYRRLGAEIKADADIRQAIEILQNKLATKSDDPELGLNQAFNHLVANEEAAAIKVVIDTLAKNPSPDLVRNLIRNYRVLISLIPRLTGANAVFSSLEAYVENATPVHSETETAA